MTEKTKALTVKDQTLDAVSKRIKAMQSGGDIHFPPAYSPQNALNSAWLILQETKTKDKQPVLQECTKVSICNALLDMVIQGLNPAKDQGYFIAYGKQLSFQRSYFGTMAVAKTVDKNISDIPAEVVYKGDKFEFEIKKGQKIVSEHKQKLENIDPEKILAAYAMIVNSDGEIRNCVIMTIEEIKSSWRMSKMNPVNDKGDIKAGSTHAEFTAEMCKRTVINRICKPIINSSNDANLKLASGRSDVIQAESDIQEEIQENANQEVFDMDIDDSGTAQISEASATSTIQDESKTEVYLTCPANINSKQPRKAISICNKCEHHVNCDPYAEYAMSQEKTMDIKPGF